MSNLTQEIGSILDGIKEVFCRKRNLKQGVLRLQIICGVNGNHFKKVNELHLKKIKKKK